MAKHLRSIEFFIKKAIKLLAFISNLLEILFFPLTLISLVWFRLIKFIGINQFPVTKWLFYKIGVTPIVKHYYEPLFDPNQLSSPLHSNRNLPSLNLNLDSQLALINKFNYQNELKEIPQSKPQGDINTIAFYYDNGSFPSGDAELYYSIIRQVKPNKIIEVGSGFSTLIASEAVKLNNSACELFCIEPYEASWLDDSNIQVLRKKVELIPRSFFKQLKENDILFIDSSHVIRPQGDVLYEILEILPLLNKGVYIHFHDIFTPNDYPLDWLADEIRLWNEQYLLEAFLSNNDSFEVVCSLNFLSHKHRDIVNAAFPIMAVNKERSPGSFWIRKID